MERAIADRPFFSIVIPAYNREKEIRRAVDSCLTQPFENFEIVVVDDGSEDGTVAVVESIADKRVVLIRHHRNRGVCPARNTGVEHSRGEWVILLDSDDELLPGALTEIWEKTHVCPEDIGQLGFLCKWDDGKILPAPVPSDMVLDYIGLIKWGDQLIFSDFVHCIRRQTFDQVKYPDSRALEDSYLLDFCLLYKIHIVPALAAIAHTDSPNRLSSMWGQTYTEKLLKNAPDQLAAIEHIIASHGPALSRYGPRQFGVVSRSRILYTFLAGRRIDGSRLAAKYLRSSPLSLYIGVIWLTGLFGPRVLAAAKRWKYLWESRNR